MYLCTLAHNVVIKTIVMETRNTLSVYIRIDANATRNHIKAFCES